VRTGAPGLDDQGRRSHAARNAALGLFERIRSGRRLALASTGSAGAPGYLMVVNHTFVGCVNGHIAW